MANPHRARAGARFFPLPAIVCLILMIAVDAPPVRAQAGSPAVRSQKSGSQAKKSRPVVAGKRGKGVKAKPPEGQTAKVAEPASASAASSSSELDEKSLAAPPARTSERVDFDSEEDAQKMEPGLELIQAAPRRARHRSLVPATPSPADSVVNRP